MTTAEQHAAKPKGGATTKRVPWPSLLGLPRREARGVYAVNGVLGEVL